VTSERLGDFVRRVRHEKNLSLQDVSNRSARFGKRIAASYVNRIENNLTRRPTADRLAALAHGLGVPVEELLARAIDIALPGDSNDELELLTRFRKLSPERKADVFRIVDMWYSDILVKEIALIEKKNKKPIRSNQFVSPVK
jgi:transcriptional regulator with XRE-family HTH domain